MEIYNGDHADFELKHQDTPKEQRPDWPLPSFDANDWAVAFMRLFNRYDSIVVDVDLMRAWFANALMRGFDEANARRTVEQRFRKLAANESAPGALTTELFEKIEQLSADPMTAGSCMTRMKEGNQADTPCPPHRWLRLGVIGNFTPNPDDPCDHCGRTYAELTTKPAPANVRYSNVSELLHNYKPHRKYAWFCSECGYPESESLKHPQKDLGNINGPGCDPEVT